MFKDAKSVPEGAAVEADICVIGTGAAGISFALEFRDSPVRVVMLESGPFEDTGRDDDLYDVETPGLAIANRSRRRGFGGTTSRWAGKWKRADLIDFTARPWVPLSGWPIARAALDPYYERASESLRAPRIVRDFQMRNLLEGTGFEPTPFLVQSPERLHWGAAFAGTFRESENVSVYLGAHVTKLVKKGAAVTEALVRSESGAWSVKARHFILACGGIENARLMLLSGIGNERDQVGRYYMDHPKGRCGIIEGYRPADLKGYWDVGGSEPFFIGFRLADAVQEEERILNSHIFLEPVYPPTLRNKIARRVFGRTASPLMTVRNYLEQAPAAENRVTLSQRTDAYGLPKARLEWNLTDLDKKTMSALHRRLKAALEHADIGSLESPLLSAPRAPFPITGDAFHHMGTTRMGTDPERSVVDPECKVHTADNLFVAGSSVFPVSGHANPTATICALAIRLADHCKTL